MLYIGGVQPSDPMPPNYQTISLAAFALLVASCANSGKAVQPTTVNNHSQQVQNSPPQIGDSPLEETGLKTLQSRADINDTPVGELGQAHGATVVVFFATWCEPCRKELQILHQLRDQYPRLRVVGINFFEEWEDLSDDRHLRAFLSVWAPWLRVVHGDPELVASFGGVRQIPAMFIFNDQGKLVRSFRKSQRALPSKGEITTAVQLALHTKKQ